MAQVQKGNCHRDSLWIRFPVEEKKIFHFFALVSRLSDEFRRENGERNVLTLDFLPTLLCASKRDAKRIIKKNK